MSIKKIEKLIKTGKFTQAVSLIDKEQKLGGAEKLNLKGVIALKTHQNLKARAYFMEAVRADGNILEFHVNFATALMECGQPGPAFDHLQKLLSFEAAQTPAVFSKLGLCAFQLSDYEASHALYKQALEKDPKHKESLSGITAALTQQARKTNDLALLDEAEVYLKQCAKIAPKDHKLLGANFKQALLKLSLDTKDADEVVKLAADNRLQVMALHENAWDKDSAQNVRTLNSATVLPGSYDWFVADDEGLYLHDMENAKPERGHYVTTFSDKNALLQIPDQTDHLKHAFMLGGSNNYYHWLIDHLPKLRFYDQQAPLLVQALSDGQRAALKTAIPHLTDIIEIDDGAKSIKVGTLIAPPSSAHKSVIHPDALAWLRATFCKADQSQTPAKKIFISRAQAKLRRIMNEADLNAIFKKHDIEVVQAETLTFAQQVELFEQTSLIIAPHGAGLSNMVFAQRAQIVEISPAASRAQDFFEILAECCGHDYMRLQAVPAPIGQDRASVHDSEFNMILEPTVLEQLLESLSA